eukprot:1158396-Pelagomonas_calceolata.AAC.16
MERLRLSQGPWPRHLKGMGAPSWRRFIFRETHLPRTPACACTGVTGDDSSPVTRVRAPHMLSVDGAECEPLFACPC